VAKKDKNPLIDVPGKYLRKEQAPRKELLEYISLGIACTSSSSLGR
jgi:hypothetical protein